ncbi:MAG: hypothetical protein A3B07_03160 [Candidatus Yonathbacteria bacterium RIFCSPLOWO2_01_FULL_43_27]|uniref:DUF5671 domain-containing protein n=2 Tax=Parcubacteria group TaxID=1794811 RepID=A0A1G2SCW9_9BACT|nr:MAG: hypothetical protein A3B07_03160 [Candidatus Yonathbacteria bacterium RIFCSPLOWO2_01_FULL_43_27]
MWGIVLYMETLTTQPGKSARVAPKDFFLWVGAMGAFYTSIIAFINLVFQYINYLYPDPLRGYQIDPYQSGISAYMAMVIVAVPVFLVLMRVIRHTISIDSTRQEIWVRRWALVFTLFVSGATIAGTLIVLLSTFLNGEELTARFLLKIATVIIVAIIVFAHFLADMKGYWTHFPRRIFYVGVAVAVIVAGTVISGFFIVGTPRQARLARYDTQRVNDLQNIQWQVVNYWQQKKRLPEKLSDLSDPISGFMLPTDPQTKEAYEYKGSSSLSFQLCAVFNGQSRTTMDGSSNMISRPYPVAVIDVKGEKIDNWHHKKGHACFERTIDPERYPPIDKIPTK